MSATQLGDDVGFGDHAFAPLRDVITVDEKNHVAQQAEIPHWPHPTRPHLLKDDNDAKGDGRKNAEDEKSKDDRLRYDFGHHWHDCFFVEEDFFDFAAIRQSQKSAITW